MVDRKCSEATLIRQGFSSKFIKDIKARIKKNAFKSQPPLIALL
jgi:hypothetical protein